MGIGILQMQHHCIHVRRKFQKLKRRDNIEYKKGCGFREKLNICKFQVEDCRAEGETYCDLYTVDWNLESIEARIEEIKKKVKDIGYIALELKNFVSATGDPKKQMPKIRELFHEINDMRKGTEYLELARAYIKRRGGISGSHRKRKSGTPETSS